MSTSISVFWRLFINSSKQSFAESLFDQIKILFGEVSLIKMEKYWKDNSLYEIEFLQEIAFDDVGKFLFKLLEKASVLSNEWNISIPDDIENRVLDLSGITESSKIRGLRWASFLIQ